MTEKQKKTKKTAVVILIVMIVFLVFLVSGIQSSLDNANEEIGILNARIVNGSECNPQEITALLRENINDIDIPQCPQCPSLTCPTYTPEQCDSVIINNDNMLMLDQFQFRYNLILDDYKELRSELKDNNRGYCKNNIEMVSDEYVKAFSYITEFIAKTELEKDSKEKAAYAVLINGNQYYKQYIADIEAYCINSKDKIDYDAYDRYATHLIFYNEVRVNSTLPRIEMLDKIKVD